MFEIVDIIRDIPYEKSFKKHIDKIKENIRRGRRIPSIDGKYIPYNVGIPAQYDPNDMERFYYFKCLRMYRKTKNINKDYAVIVYLSICYARRILNQRTILNINKERAIIHTEGYNPWILRIGKS